MINIITIVIIVIIISSITVIIIIIIIPISYIITIILIVPFYRLHIKEGAVMVEEENGAHFNLPDIHRASVRLFVAYVN